MKTLVLVTGLLLFLMVWSFGSLAASGNRQDLARHSTEANESSVFTQDQRNEAKDEDADLGKWARSGVDREEYLRLRDEYIARKRGIGPGWPFDPSIRGRAIDQMERQEKNRKIESLVNGSLTPPIGVTAAWTPIGPSPLPILNGGVTFLFSGRVTCVVVDPTNPSKVYLGTAQGGVWRSLDGGATWVSIFDSAQSLAIGALALAPSDPTILYVGTGEFNLSVDSFFGVGLYRIETVDTTPTLVGPINPSQTIGNLTYNIFNGRSISKILVDPTNPATIFVASGAGLAGLGANQLGMVPQMGTRGLYRSTNATSAANSVTFQKLVVSTDNSFDIPATGNVSISDMVMEPGNPDHILVGVLGLNGTSSGVYRTTNALTTGSFTQRLALPPVIRVQLAINKVGSVVTVYAATSETPTNTPGCTTSDSGAIRKSLDGGTTWGGQLTGGGGFCRAQCLYDMPIAVDPNDASVVYIGGQISDSCGRSVGKSTNGGASFATDSNGLHADNHSLFFDGAGNIYTGNDGGVWKRSASATAGSAWTNLNSGLNTLQFEGIAVHPTDRFLMIGGTQDNGTEYQQTSSGNWHGAESGDGGYSLIDQSATDTTNVTMYHTFNNSSGSRIGFDRSVNTACLAVFDSWPTRGAFGGSNVLTPVPCDGTASYIQNGININDNVLFYAPMALGPGAPNTVYFGTDRLYRSTDRGDTMTVVSQAPVSVNPTTGLSSPVSTIAIWPGGDNIRMVGLENGQVWATSTGSSTLVNLTSASFPTNPTGDVTNKFVGRAVIDPNNQNVAYISFSFFTPSGQGIWKITNLVAASGASPAAPVWTSAGNGIPSIPINGLVIDPINSNNIYAGTDIGVYASTDGGANWSPFGTGLPRSAVFDLQIQPSNRILRAATHGRGVWETTLISSGASTLQFSASNYGVGEGAGFVTITVNRIGDTSGASSIDFQTSDGSAKQALDYVATSGTLSFGSGEISKTFNVVIIDDALFEPNETLNLTLSNATGATLAAPSTATITITDNDFPRSKKTGVFRPSTGELFLKNTNSSGFADTYIIFGNPGDYPVAGDWNGDGVDSVGIYRNGVFFLRNTNSTGFADIVVPFGNPGDQPVVGDWDGDGVDTIGIYRNGNFILRNSNTAGPPDLVFALGDPGDVGIAGDWNGDGITTCGVFRPSNGIVYLKNSNTTGFADLSFVYGNAGDKPVAGDWNGDGIDTVGIYRSGLFFLTNSNTTGFADIVFVLGNSGDFPIAGNWNGSP